MQVNAREQRIDCTKASMVLIEKETIDWPLLVEVGKAPIAEYQRKLMQLDV